jgi:hypothetical protein
VDDRAYTDAELDDAIAALTDGERLREAQDLVMRTAPALQRVLATALQEGGWFDPGHEQALRDATSVQDPDERTRAVRTMLADESRLGMLVGVAVGFELARELTRSDGDPPTSRRQDPPTSNRQDAPASKQHDPPSSNQQEE